VTVAFFLPGGVPVYAFSLLLGLGTSLGLLLIAFQAGCDSALVPLRSGFGVILGGIIGGHLAYVGVNWAYFQSHPQEILQLPIGGFSWGGVVIGVFLTMLLLTAVGYQPLPWLIDTAFPLLAAVTIVTWLACWLDGCAYGFPISTRYAVLAKDEWGSLATRWPLQLVGALITLAILTGVELVRRRKTDWVSGVRGSIGFFGLSLQWWILSTLRADPAPLWQGQRLETWLAMIFTVLAFLTTVFFFLRQSNLWKNHLTKKL
jgi:phosphatidylglycerol:prolipoprotein diacylglycerol transferase